MLLNFLKPVVLSCCLVASSAWADEDSIRRAFGEYRNSVLSNNGTAALSHVSASTVEYYGAIQQLALRATPDIVKQANIGDRLLILMVRHRVDAETLKSMDGQKLFVHAVNQGWIGKNGVEKLEIGSVAVRNGIARALMVAGGKRTPIQITMKEEGTWRVDLTSILPVTNEAFGQAVANMGMSENDFILLTLDSLSGRTVPDTIWQPVSR